MIWKRYSQADIGCDTCCNVKQLWRKRDYTDRCYGAASWMRRLNLLTLQCFYKLNDSSYFLSSSLCPTGYFTQISTLADVQENVMEYLHVLSRPKVIDQEHDTVWTEAYIDSTVSWLCRPSHGTPAGLCTVWAQNILWLIYRCHFILVRKLNP